MVLHPIDPCYLALQGASPVAQPKQPAQPVSDNGIPRKVVYVPSCVTRMMGPSKSDTEQASVHQKMLSLFEKAGYEVVYPEVGMGCSRNRWLLICSTVRVRQALLWSFIAGLKGSTAAAQTCLSCRLGLPFHGSPAVLDSSLLHSAALGTFTGQMLPRGMWATDTS